MSPFLGEVGAPSSELKDKLKDYEVAFSGGHRAIYNLRNVSHHTHVTSYAQHAQQ